MTDQLRAMEFSADLIVRDMQRQFGQPHLVCDVCGIRRFGSWGSLKTGWPKHHGYTMRLVIPKREAVSDD